MTKVGDESQSRSGSRKRKREKVTKINQTDPRPRGHDIHPEYVVHPRY